LLTLISNLLLRAGSFLISAGVLHSSLLFT
jgi:hypothetical protein